MNSQDRADDRQAATQYSQGSASGDAAASHRVSLIGAPSDIGAGTRGASMGPEALRVAGIGAMLQSQGLDVCDRGDVRGPANPSRGPVDGYRHLDEVTQWNHAVHDAVYRELSDARLPILLGGDHSLSIGSLSAVARHCRERGRKLRVLWLDAHADFNTRVLTPSGNLHGMPVACLCGLGPKKLIEMSGRVPALDAASIRQIGIRSVDQGEKRLVHEVGLEVFDMRFIDEAGMRETLAQALESLDRDAHLHVSFDVDFLDPEIAPGVGTTVPGGPSYREAQLCMEMIADTGRLGSLDIMELNPALDLRNRTATVAVDLVASLFGKSTLMRRETESSPQLLTLCDGCCTLTPAAAR
jgi:arginase